MFYIIFLIQYDLFISFYNISFGPFNSIFNVILGQSEKGWRMNKRCMKGKTRGQMKDKYEKEGEQTIVGWRQRGKG